RDRTGRLNLTVFVTHAEPDAAGVHTRKPIADGAGDRVDDRLAIGRPELRPTGGDRDRGRRQVDHPGERGGRRIGTPGVADGTNRKRVVPLRETAEARRTRACAEWGAVQRTLEARDR